MKFQSLMAAPPPVTGTDSMGKKLMNSVKKYLPRHSKVSYWQYLRMKSIYHHLDTRQSDVEKVYKFGKDLGTGNFAVVKVPACHMYFTHAI